ncbi:MAG TPA: hypothetical protein PKD34_01430 [Candidatus Doudnabacteria bacterium]|nr:hypothetical protein [Candidatus Doudnabacteria bacterium]
MKRKLDRWNHRPSLIERIFGKDFKNQSQNTNHLHGAYDYTVLFGRTVESKTPQEITGIVFDWYMSWSKTANRLLPDFRVKSVSHSACQSFASIIFVFESNVPNAAHIVNEAMKPEEKVPLVSELAF